MTPYRQARQDRREMQERAERRRERHILAIAALAIREGRDAATREREEARLQEQISAMLASGEVTICPPGKASIF